MLESLFRAGCKYGARSSSNQTDFSGTLGEEWSETEAKVWQELDKQTLTQETLQILESTSFTSFNINYFPKSECLQIYSGQTVFRLICSFRNLPLLDSLVEKFPDIDFNCIPLNPNFPGSVFVYLIDQISQDKRLNSDPEFTVNAANLLYKILSRHPEIKLTATTLLALCHLKEKADNNYKELFATNIKLAIEQSRGNNSIKFSNDELKNLLYKTEISTSLQILASLYLAKTLTIPKPQTDEENKRYLIMKEKIQEWQNSFTNLGLIFKNNELPLEIFENIITFTFITDPSMAHISPKAIKEELYRRFNI